VVVDQRELVHSYGGLERDQGAERLAVHRCADGDQELHADLYWSRGQRERFGNSYGSGCHG
jgi:hypothetical protein